MTTIGPDEIRNGFVVGYHGGWDATNLTCLEVLRIERELKVAKRQALAQVNKKDGRQ